MSLKESGQLFHMKSLAEIERCYILTVFKSCNKNINQTALVLGIGRQTVYRKLKQYEETEKFFRDNQKEIETLLKSLVETKTE